MFGKLCNCFVARSAGRSRRGAVGDNLGLGTEIIDSIIDEISIVLGAFVASFVFLHM